MVVVVPSLMIQELSKMKAVKVVVEDGNVILDEPLPAQGRFDAILVLLDPDPWDALVHDPRARPELAKAREQAHREFLQGKTTPLNPDKMPRSPSQHATSGSCIRNFPSQCVGRHGRHSACSATIRHIQAFHWNACGVIPNPGRSESRATTGLWGQRKGIP